MCKEFLLKSKFTSCFAFLSTWVYRVMESNPVTFYLSIMYFFARQLIVYIGTGYQKGSSLMLSIHGAIGILYGWTIECNSASTHRCFPIIMYFVQAFQSIEVTWNEASAVEIILFWAVVIHIYLVLLCLAWIMLSLNNCAFEPYRPSIFMIGGHFCLTIYWLTNRNHEWSLAEMVLAALNNQRCTQIARSMGPTWSPPGSCRPQMGPMLTPWTLQSGYSRKSNSIAIMAYVVST